MERLIEDACIAIAALTAVRLALILADALPRMVAA